MHSVRAKFLGVFIKQYGTILKNLSYLGVLQLTNLLLPIITYPILIKNLGSDRYGEIIFVQALLGYFVVLINFGFNITGTKKISEYRQNLKKINEIVSCIYCIKGVLFLFSSGIVALYLINAKVAIDTIYLYGLSMWVCVNELIMPVWYFHGTEKMKFITIATLINRIITVVLILIFINNSSDYLLVPLIYFFGTIVSCGLALRVLYNNDVSFILPSLNQLQYYLKTSFVMAISFGVNTFKTNFNLVVVKFFFPYSVVAYFDLALKIINIVISFLDLISQAIYPKISISKDMKFLKRIMLVSIICSIVAMIIVQLCAYKIVNVLGGDIMIQSSTLLIILASVFPFYITGALLGRNCLLIFGHDTTVLKSMVYSAIVYISLLLLIWFLNGHLTLRWIAVSFILSFAFEAVYRFIKVDELKLFNYA